MTLDVVLTASAVEDLEAVTDYLLPRSPQGLASVLATIEACLERIGRDGDPGRKTALAGVREVVEPRYG